MSVAMKSSNIIAISTSSWSTFSAPATRSFGPRRPYSERVVEHASERDVSCRLLRSAAGGSAAFSEASESGGADTAGAAPDGSGVASSVTSTACSAARAAMAFSSLSVVCRASLESKDQSRPLSMLLSSRRA